MTGNSHCWRQAAIEFDLNILVHEPAVSLEPGFFFLKAGKPHTFFQFLKGNLTLAVEQRTKK